jgi:hypothetical protein
MQVPFHGDFATTPMSALKKIRWWVREIERERSDLRAEVAALRTERDEARKALLTLYEMYQDTGTPSSYASLLRQTGLWGWIKGQVGMAGDEQAPFTTEEIEASARAQAARTEGK